MRDVEFDRRRGSAAPAVIALLFVAAVVAGGWYVYDQRAKKRKAREAAILAYNAEQRRLRELADAQKTVVAVDTQVVEKVERPVEVKPKEKTGAEVWREDFSGWQAAQTQLAEAAAKAEKPLNGLGGIAFGSEMNLAPVRWGLVQPRLDAACVESNGVMVAVQGPAFTKSFLSFGTRPLVWVTPRTRKVCRIELERPLKIPPGAAHDPETTNALAVLRARFGVEPVALWPIRPERPGCEYVFALKDARLKVGEYGDALRLTAESDTFLRAALEESKAQREARRAAVKEAVKILDSTRYPNRPIDKKKYKVRFQDVTPRMFCGVVFASQPPENARMYATREGGKGFFLDYGKAKCRAFNGFDHGRADIDPLRGGVYAVTLLSEGGAEGLTDADYFQSVRDTLDARYQVAPAEEKGKGAFPKLTYTVGDLTVTFGGDDGGGFVLRAENKILAELARAGSPPARRPALKRN